MADENIKSSDKIESSDSDKPEQSTGSKQNQDFPLGLSTSKVCSPSVTSSFIKPAISFSSQTSELKGNILGPSLFNGNTNSTKSTSFILNPSKLNPFSKTPICEDSKTNAKADVTPKFLPLIQNGTKPENKSEVSDNKPQPSTSQSNFVFGQNIQDRVVSDKPVCDSSSSNGTTESEMLFTTAMKDTSGASSKPNSNKTLSESAREYEESRANKRRYEEVEIKTGEEGETNVLQISCKLFAYDKTGGGTWQERGRGTLRLNDQHILNSTHIPSRLVFRTTGSLRVNLNTKIWPEMTVQLASNKSIRFTAFDSAGEIRVFLVTGSPDDIKQLHRHLEIRVSKEIACQKQREGEDSILTEPERKKPAPTNE